MSGASRPLEMPIGPAELASERRGLLDEIIDSMRPSPDASSRARAEDLVRAFARTVLEPAASEEREPAAAIHARIAAIDALLSAQVDEILHAAAFQALEASWRGLHQLVTGAETSELLRIRVLNVSRHELARDFRSAVEFTESALWKKVVQDEFGTFGGDPFGALIGDFEFGKSSADVELLQRVSEVAAAAHAPFLSAASPDMFGLDRFTELMDPRDLARKFDRANPENTKWLALRDSESARFLALVLPHVLRRLPYGSENPVEGFLYTERAHSHADFLWGNAAYELGGRLAEAFARHHWCVQIRGPEGGGKVESLPVHTFRTGEGDVASKCPTEVLIPDTREKELSDLGFIGLLHCKNTDFAAFFGGNSIQRPARYDLPEATASARLSAQIPYLMVSCRIAHYLKAICRDKIGAFQSRSECEAHLNRWIHGYVLEMDDAAAESKAERPLRAARIDVFDDRARPGCYQARAYLRPHFQLDEIRVSIGLVTDLPESRTP
jgi:type VI secretion system protein ImpC